MPDPKTGLLTYEELIPLVRNCPEGTLCVVDIEDAARRHFELSLEKGTPYGGDLNYQLIAGWLRQGIRSNAVQIARWGGDTFAVLVPGDPGLLRESFDPGPPPIPVHWGFATLGAAHPFQRAISDQRARQRGLVDG